MKNKILKGFYATGTKSVKDKVKGEDGKTTSENRTVNVRIEFPEIVGTSRAKAESYAREHAKKEKITLDGIFPFFASDGLGKIMVKRTKAQRALGEWNKHTKDLLKTNL